LLSFSNYEVQSLQADANKTLESAYSLLAEQDKTSILFHEEIHFLQNARYHRGPWVFRIGGAKKVETEETLIFLDQNRKKLKRGWTALEKQRRQLILFLEKIQRMKASFYPIGIHDRFLYTCSLPCMSQVYLSNVVGETTGLELIFEDFGELLRKSNRSK
jgi:hypothetical protein